MNADIDKRRKALARAQVAGDHEREAVIRGELLKLHRRALRHALALDDLEALAAIRREMESDLAPVTAAQAAVCPTAMLLDLRRESARQHCEAACGPFELERLLQRPEPYVALARAADDSVRVTASLRDEEAVAAYCRTLMLTQPGVLVRHDLNPALAAALEAHVDAVVAFGEGGAA